MKVTTDIDYEAWQHLVDSSLVASYFQTPECYRFYGSVAQLKSFAFALVGHDGNVLGVMCGYIQAEGNKLKQYFSRRAIIPGGVLLHEAIQEEEICFFLTHVITKLRREAIYIEIRNYSDYSKHQKAFQQAGFAYVPYLNYQLSIQDEQTHLAGLSESKRRQLMAAMRQGVSWKQTTSEADLKAFYSCLHTHYSSKIKKPVFGLSFFEALMKQPSSRLLVVKKGETFLGGMFCVVLDRRCVYEWYVCGKDTEYRKLYPSVVATWAGIAYAAQQGIQVFDFMGAGKPGEHYGVREFKSKFGATLVENGRFRFIAHRHLYKLGEIVMHYLRKRT